MSATVAGPMVVDYCCFTEQFAYSVFSLFHSFHIWHVNKYNSLNYDALLNCFTQQWQSNDENGDLIFRTNFRVFFSRNYLLDTFCLVFGYFWACANAMMRSSTTLIAKLCTRGSTFLDFIWFELRQWNWIFHIIFGLTDKYSRKRMEIERNVIVSSEIIKIRVPLLKNVNAYLLQCNHRFLWKNVVEWEREKRNRHITRTLTRQQKHSCKFINFASLRTSHAVEVVCFFRIFLYFFFQFTIVVVAQKFIMKKPKSRGFVHFFCCRPAHTNDDKMPLARWLS